MRKGLLTCTCVLPKIHNLLNKQWNWLPKKQANTVAGTKFAIVSDTECTSRKTPWLHAEHYYQGHCAPHQNQLKHKSFNILRLIRLHRRGFEHHLFNLIEMHRKEVGLTSLPGCGSETFSFDEFQESKVLSFPPGKTKTETITSQAGKL